ncbi:MAG: cation:proton antiporter [Acidobacteria bacterium]|nr:cation:proton antiporter [Acidobacteriota bacterium]
MISFSQEVFVSMLALTGAVIVASALLSGLVERSGLPQVAVFLALGALIGPAGLGLLDAGVNSPILLVVATLSLVLVLFTDALSLDIGEMRQHRLLAVLVLGPGTLASAALIALAARWLLDLPPAMAAILGAALASTDPVLLRGLLRRPGLDRGVRQALRLESGLNDAALLPIVLVMMAVLGQSSPLTGRDWAKLGLNMLLLSPAAGVAVGLLGVAALEFVRRRIGVRRDYESLYSLGVAFAAFAAAETVHGSGFLAAFAAGLTIAALDVELCDCFLEYGETTAEMALLFTFVLFGTSLIWSGLVIVSPSTLRFTGAVLLLRPLAFLPALSLVRGLTWRNRWLIAWFGPRGLSSLLLVLLPVFAGVPGTEQILPVCCLVVLVSVVVHGISPLVLLRESSDSASAHPVSGPIDSRPASPEPAPGRRSIAASDAKTGRRLADPQYIEIPELQALQRAGELVVVVDARTDRTFNDSEFLAQGAMRLSPDRAILEAEQRNLPRDFALAVFCA